MQNEIVAVKMSLVVVPLPYSLHVLLKAHGSLLVFQCA